MVWHIGNFGRFKIENPKFPRFEVIASDKKRGQVTVWYSGRDHTTIIPRETFLEDCVNWWEIDKVEPIPERPRWLYPGVEFSMNSLRRAINVQVTEVTIQFQTTSHAVDINRKNFVFRSQIRDYISCVCTDPKSRILVLVPLRVVIEHGHHQKNIYDRIRNFDVLSGEEDIFEDV